MRMRSPSPLREAWRSRWRLPAFRYLFLACLALLAAMPVFFHWFFGYIEARTGDRWSDPLLERLPGRDVSWVVFFFLYSGVLLGLARLRALPDRLLLAVQTYLAVNLLRVLSLSLIPLEPPVGYIPLQEPFVQLFTPGGTIISKDLFFSGHVSTILAFYLALPKGTARQYLLLCTGFVSIGVLLQHVHYTVDVLAAFLGTFLSFRVGVWVQRYLGLAHPPVA